LDELLGRSDRIVKVLAFLMVVDRYGTTANASGIVTATAVVIPREARPVPLQGEVTSGAMVIKACRAATDMGAALVVVEVNGGLGHRTRNMEVATLSMVINSGCRGIAL
jgi:hypothetical protein